LSSRAGNRWWNLGDWMDFGSSPVSSPR